ncbi:hypothetical protein EYF80_036152 [Liparis tanakae]|uniref:Uncharacterized protein n=1 Tax=Liparis tanakae TaxID=230148 RepID=A0A4Z2GLG5_9TELE|nr:hypothetical protein EYF80_036152 [Liparis tanakae]
MTICASAVARKLANRVELEIGISVDLRSPSHFGPVVCRALAVPSADVIDGFQSGREGLSGSVSWMSLGGSGDAQISASNGFEDGEVKPFYPFKASGLRGQTQSTINLRLSVAIVFSGQQPRRVKAKLQPVREHTLCVQPSRGTSAMYLGTAALKLSCQSDPLCGLVLQKPGAARGGCDG